MVFAFLKRTPVYLMMPTGEYNGYVGWTPDEGELPLSEQGNWNLTGGLALEGDSLDDLIDVHGGITFDTVFDKDYVELFADRRDLTGIPEDLLGCRIIGFDTCHYGDKRDLSLRKCQ